MKRYYGYIRVSTVKQGTHGVSLVEQKAAIERYALRVGLPIDEWFEERETAAKRGRPVFMRMLSLLRQGKAAGVVIHKIDRSARNLKDWADLGELIDAGVDVHFAADALDLASRGGRLSADIQAVVAADYIRNLREETRKGFYGRLKQGFYPLAAPLGYLDRGGGKPKTLDPKTAPLVRRVFEAYASGAHSLRSLQRDLGRIGLRNKRGGALSLHGLSNLLNNPFYCGLIRLKSSGQTFKGVHEPLVSVAMFDRIQSILKGKSGPKIMRHEWMFRRMIRCALCTRTLTAERQKGHVYYRCHTSSCPTTGIREECVGEALRVYYTRAQLFPEDFAELRDCLADHRREIEQSGVLARAGADLRLADARQRLNRLTDALVDGLIERDAYEVRRSTLLLDISRMEEEGGADESAEKFDRVGRMFELAASLIPSYDSADFAQKRQIIETTTSNLALRGKYLEFTPSEPFRTFAEWRLVPAGDPQRHTVRTTEICQRRKRMDKFVDAMLGKQAANDVGGPVVRTTDEEGGGRYDPSVYALIQRKREKYKDTLERREFDAALRHRANECDSKVSGKLEGHSGGP